MKQGDIQLPTTALAVNCVVPCCGYLALPPQWSLSGSPYECHKLCLRATQNKPKPAAKVFLPSLEAGLGNTAATTNPFHGKHSCLPSGSTSIGKG